MKIGNLSINYTSTEATGKEPPKQIGKELSSADSYLYEPYTLRPYNPDELYQKKDSFDLFDRMREDDQIFSLLNLKKLIVLNSDWVIESDNEEAVEFLTACLDDYLELSFIKYLYNIMTALDYGFSVTEKIMSYKKTPFGDRIVFDKLKTRAPHTFEFHTDSQGNLEKLVQKTSKNDLELEPNKFIIFTHQKEFDNYYGRSELNWGVYRAFVAKDALIKFWNIRLERYGMPTAIGKMPRSAGEGEKNLFKQILKNIQSKTSITTPDDFTVEFLEAANSTGEYEQALNKYDLMIARKMLIPDLLGFSGAQTGGGSYALGKQQFNIFYTAIEFLRTDLQRLVNRDLIQPLALWNYGSGLEAEFKFKKVDEERRANDMELWLKAVQTGKVPVTPQHVNWFLDLVNAPEITDEEFAKIEDEKKAMQEQLQGNKPEEEKDDPANPNEDEKGDESPDKKKAEPKKDLTMAYLPFTNGARPLVEIENQIDFAQIEKDTAEMEQKYVESLGKIFRLSINGLIDDIRRDKIVEGKKFSKIKTLELRNLGKVHKQVGAMMNEAFVYGSQSAKNFSVIQGEFLDTKEVQEWIKSYGFFVEETEIDFILKMVKPAIIEGIREGKGINEIVKGIEDSLKGYDEIDPVRLETIARTVVSAGFNEARWQQFQELDDVVAYFYSAVMDGRTSPMCELLDGRYLKPNEAAAVNPPNHFLCRSILIPVFKGEVEKGEIQGIPKDLEKDQGSFWKIRKGD